MHIDPGQRHWWQASDDDAQRWLLLSGTVIASALLLGEHAGDDDRAAPCGARASRAAGRGRAVMSGARAETAARATAIIAQQRSRPFDPDPRAIAPEQPQLDAALRPAEGGLGGQPDRHRWTCSTTRIRDDNIGRHDQERLRRALGIRSQSQCFFVAFERSGTPMRVRRPRRGHLSSDRRGEWHDHRCSAASVLGGETRSPARADGDRLAARRPASPSTSPPGKSTTTHSSN